MLDIKELTRLVNSIRNTHKVIEHLDISLDKFFPIAVIDDNVFYVFDYDFTNKSYQYVMKHQSDIDIPKDVRAALKLNFYNNKMAVVVSIDAFVSTQEHLVIFHEFVHCYQGNTFESRFKSNLNIYNTAIKNNDYMWELNYNFPFDDNNVTKIIKRINIVNINNELKELKSILANDDFEYMIWQMFKEGYARYIENKMRRYFQYPPKNVELNGIIDRSIFYQLGELYFSNLERSIDKFELEEVFYELLNI